MTIKTTKTVLSVLLVLAAVDPSLAQRTMATFGGTVEDQSHAVLPGVQVSLINEGTSATLEQLSNERGEFLFDFVPVGIYTLKLNMPGFKNLESRGNSLGAAQTVRRTYTMEVGGVTGEVTVTGEAAQVNTVSPEQRLALDTLQVTSLPMINRNVTTIDRQVYQQSRAPERGLCDRQRPADFVYAHGNESRSTGENRKDVVRI